MQPFELVLRGAPVGSQRRLLQDRSTSRVSYGCIIMAEYAELTHSLGGLASQTVIVRAVGPVRTSSIRVI
jgi:hypothetical protein